MKMAWLAALLTAASFGQVTIPDGTKLRVRLDQTISSATADEGQTVELSVTEAVKVGDTIVFPEGARVTGTITTVQAKRRMGRAGKLDFSVDRARAMDGEWIPLRYTLNKRTGNSHATRTGILTAGVAVVFWPAAPFMLLMKGKDTAINKGVVFDVFTDVNHIVKMPAPGQQMNPPAPPAFAPAMPAAPAFTPVAQSPPAAAGGMATVTFTSPVPGAEIEVNGAFVGNTPTTMQLPAGAHNITIKHGSQIWQRSVQIGAGSNVTINGNLPGAGMLAGRGKLQASH